MEIIKPHRNKNTESLMMPNIPDEIINYNILTRLPAISLLRFKCVSKDWYTLISSSTFISIHLTYAFDFFVIDRTKRPNPSSCDYRKHWIYTYFGNFHNSKSVTDFPMEYNQSDCPVVFVGSSNGLFCCLTFSNRSGRQGFMLCNPLTRECSKYIDHPHYVCGNYGTTHYGFGYDSVSCVYKIVVIIFFYTDISKETVSHICAYVYSANNDSWKEIEKVPQSIYLSGRSEAVCNKLHWFDLENRYGKPCKFLTFDLCNEKFGEMPISAEIREHCLYVKLMVSSGLLYVMTSSLPTCGDKSIWVMKEYGVQESWTKLCQLPEGLFVSLIKMNTRESGRNNGEVLLNKFDIKGKTRELVWYNLEDKSFQKVDHHEKRRNIEHPWMCLASLVPIPDNIRVHRGRNVVHELRN